jgi:hypothetical protein
MTCGVCSDRRVVEKPDGTFRPCVCAIQDKVKECLYEFADANLNRKISYEKLHRNMVIRKSDISRFRDLAKTYLTHRVVRTMDFELDHINCTGSEVTEAYFNNHEVLTFSYIMNVPILFCKNGLNPQVWDTIHSKKHFLLAADHIELMRIFAEYAKNGIGYYKSNARNLNMI